MYKLAKFALRNYRRVSDNFMGIMLMARCCKAQDRPPQISEFMQKYPSAEDAT